MDKLGVSDKIAASPRSKGSNDRTSQQPSESIRLARKHLDSETSSYSFLFNTKFMESIDINMDQVPVIPALLTPSTFLEMINNAYMRSVKLLTTSVQEDHDYDSLIKNITYMAEVLELLSDSAKTNTEIP